MRDITFRVFFAEFMRLGDILIIRNSTLLKDLSKKLLDNLILILRRCELGPRASL